MLYIKVDRDRLALPSISVWTRTQSLQIESVNNL